MFRRIGPPCGHPHEGVDELVGDPDPLKQVRVRVAPAPHAPTVERDRFNLQTLQL